MWAAIADRWAARPALAAAAVYAVLSLLMVGQGLAPGRTLSGSDFLYGNVPWKSERPADVPPLGANFELADPAVVFQPFLRYTRDRLPHVPLWNPYIAGGRPYLANAQSAVLSPFSAPAYVLPFWRSLAVIAALKLFFAALGTYLLARVLRMRFGGALLAGVIFAFGTFFVVWLAWPLTSIFAVIPWLLLLCEVTVRRPSLLSGAGLAGLVALTYLGGHPETTFHALVVTVAYFAVRLASRARSEGTGLRGARAPALNFVLALVAGTALAAVVVVPFAELLLHSGDITRRLHQRDDFWPRKYLGALFLHDYWGRPTQYDIEPFMQIRGWYAGALTLMLASAALIIRPTLRRIGFALLGLFTVIMVLGLGPVFHAVVALPGFRSSHNQRMLIFFLLALALLAGWGLDDLTRRSGTQVGRRALVLGAGAAIFCVPFVWMAATGTLTSHGFGHALDVAWGFSDPPAVDVRNSGSRELTGDVVRMGALLQWIPLAGIGLGLVALRLRRARPLPAVAFVSLAVLLVAVDLFRANMGFNTAIHTRDATVPRTGAIRYLESRRPYRFAGLTKRLSFQPLPPDTAMRFGLYDARAYDYPAAKRYDRLWRRNVAPGVPDFTQPEVVASATPAAIRALDLLSVADIVQDPADRPVRLPGLRTAYRGRDAIVYRNDHALPRVFLAGSQQHADGGEAALAAATAPGFDARRVVVTERPIPGVPQRATGSAGASGGARLVSYGAEHATVDADARRRSVLVLTDVFFPGWKATVDGRSAPIEQVDYLLRGVALPPGRHRVEFRYEPASFRAGWIVSLAALAAVLGAALAGLRRRRRPRSGPRA